jgi:hypothetical protein
LQMLQMEGEGGWRDAEAFGDQAGRQPVRPLLHEHSVHSKPVLVGQGTQGLNRFVGGQDGAFSRTNSAAPQQAVGCA